MKKDKYCLDCNKLISHYAIRCKSCANKKENNPFYGKKHSVKTKRLLSGPRESLRGKNNPNYGKGLFGKDNPNWRGGISFIDGYSNEFKKIISPYLRKYFKQCRECGNKNNLIVHHIDYDKKNNDLMNLIVLCLKCHMKSNFKRILYFNKFRFMNEFGISRNNKFKLNACNVAVYNKSTKRR